MEPAGSHEDPESGSWSAADERTLVRFFLVAGLVAILAACLPAAHSALRLAAVAIGVLAGGGLLHALESGAVARLVALAGLGLLLVGGGRGWLDATTDGEILRAHDLPQGSGRQMEGRRSTIGSAAGRICSASTS